MSEPLDPFDLLRDLNPIDPSELADAASSEDAQHALTQILAGARHRRGSRRFAFRVDSLRRRGYLLAIISLGAVGVAAAAWALTHGATKHLTVGCYESVSLQARTVVVPAQDEPPTSTCRAVWARGDFGTHATPRLQACVLPSGAIGVFPTSDETACQQLKLPPVSATTTAPAQTGPATPRVSLIALKSILVQKFLSTRCMNEGIARRLVQTELRRLRFANWQVRAGGTFTNDRPCASLAFDEDRDLVLLVPIPKR
jgi:hypothetical protein